MDFADVKGKKSIVTGGGRGLGKAMAEALHDAGSEVVLMGTNEHVLKAAQSMSKSGVPVHGVICDFGNLESVERGFDCAFRLLEERVDILVNSAGMQIQHKCEEFPLEDWQTVINVNLTAAFLMAQLAGAEMLRVGKGKIVNIASMLSYRGGYHTAAYAASKGGIAQLTKAFANEWASQGINVNAIAPGYMITENAEIENETRNWKIIDRIPAKRWGLPSDLTGAVLFLSSSASDYVHGIILPVDGGFLAR